MDESDAASVQRRFQSVRGLLSSLMSTRISEIASLLIGGTIVSLFEFLLIGVMTLLVQWTDLRDFINYPPTILWWVLPLPEPLRSLVYNYVIAFAIKASFVLTSVAAVKAFGFLGGSFFASWAASDSQLSKPIWYRWQWLHCFMTPWWRVMVHTSCKRPSETNKDTYTAAGVKGLIVISLVALLSSLAAATAALKTHNLDDDGTPFCVAYDSSRSSRVMSRQVGPLVIASLPVRNSVAFNIRVYDAQYDFIQSVPNSSWEWFEECLGKYTERGTVQFGIFNSNSLDLDDLPDAMKRDTSESSSTDDLKATWWDVDDSLKASTNPIASIWSVAKSPPFGGLGEHVSVFVSQISWGFASNGTFKPLPYPQGMTCELIQELLHDSAAEISRCSGDPDLFRGDPLSVKTWHACNLAAFSKFRVPAKIQKFFRRDRHEEFCSALHELMEPLRLAQEKDNLSDYQVWQLLQARRIEINMVGDVLLQVPYIADEWVFIITFIFGNFLLLVILKLVLKSRTPADQLTLLASMTCDGEGWEGAAPIAYMLQQIEVQSDPKVIQNVQGSGIEESENLTETMQRQHAQAPP